MKLPYAISDFARIREDGYFYADKTRVIERLEDPRQGYSYALFLRPRRFGKTTLLSMLEHYYDLAYKDQFDSLPARLTLPHVYPHRRIRQAGQRPHRARRPRRLPGGARRLRIPAPDVRAHQGRHRPAGAARVHDRGHADHAQRPGQAGSARSLS